MEWIFAESFASSSSGQIDRRGAKSRSVPISYDLEVEPGTVGHNIRNHFLIADPSGHTVNWADEKNCFTRRLSVGKGFPYHQLPLSFKAADCNRHPILKKGMTDVRVGFRDEALEKSQQTITLWSCVYDLKRLTMELCIDLDFDFTFRFDFKKKIAEGERHVGFGNCGSGRDTGILGKGILLPKKIYHTAEELKKKIPDHP